MSWFKQLWDRLWKYGKQQRKPSLYQVELDALDRIRVDTDVYADTRVVVTVVGNIEDYTRWLTTVNYALHGDLLFPQHEFRLEAVKRCQFWRNAKGDFIDVKEHLERFRSIARKVLLRHEAVSALKHKGDKIAANMYRTQAILYDLRRLVKHL